MIDAVAGATAAFVQPSDEDIATAGAAAVAAAVTAWGEGDDAHVAEGIAASEGHTGIAVPGGAAIVGVNLPKYRWVATVVIVAKIYPTKGRTGKVRVNINVKSIDIAADGASGSYPACSIVGGLPYTDTEPTAASFKGHEDKLVVACVEGDDGFAKVGADGFAKVGATGAGCHASGGVPVSTTVAGERNAGVAIWCRFGISEGGDDIVAITRDRTLVLGDAGVGAFHGDEVRVISAPVVGNEGMGAASVAGRAAGASIALRFETTTNHDLGGADVGLLVNAHLINLAAGHPIHYLVGIGYGPLAGRRIAVVGWLRHTSRDAAGARDGSGAASAHASQQQGRQGHQGQECVPLCRFHLLTFL
jgi:hypothetical protein